MPDHPLAPPTSLLDRILCEHAAQLCTVNVADGERLVLPADKLWILQRGEVLVYAGPRPIELWTGLRALDVAGGLRGCASAGFVAVGEVELRGLQRSRLSPEQLTALLVEESETLWRRIEHDVQRDDDCFTTGAVPVPGPWWFKHARVVALVVAGDPARMAATMPRGVRPLPGCAGRYVLAIAQFEGAGSEDPEDSNRFCYREVTPFWPAWSRWRGPCAFIPELYPDAWMAMVLGREILGFPKRTARIGLREHGAELLRERRLAMRTRWSAARELEPAAALGALARTLFARPGVGRLTHAAVEHFPERLALAALVHKRIGAPHHAGRSFAIDELVRVPVRLDPIRRAQALDGLELDLLDTAGPLHGEVLGGWRLESGIHFGAGRPLRGRPQRGGSRP